MKNSTFNCIRYEDDLKAYADGELSWLRRSAVRRHLTHCASCQKEILEMTQIAEQLHASESEDALSPALREKILGVPGTGSAGLLKAQSPSVTADSGVAKRLSPNSSPALPVPGRSRRPLAWGLAVAALVAWFVCFPLFQKVRENPQRLGDTTLYAPLPERVASSPPQPKSKPMPPASAALPSSNSTDGFASRSSDRAATTPVMPPSAALNATTPSARLAPMVVRGGGVPLVLDRNGSLNSLSADGSTDPLRQVHKEASIGVQVANPETTGDTINTMVQQTGGYVAANNLTTGEDGLKSGELIVKVPVTQFETFLAQVAKLGIVQSKNISGEDITEKTSDADQEERVREDDVQQSEARLKALGSKAKWHDEQATRDLRIQLAQAQARLVLLKRMAALGTITIDLSQTPKAVPTPPVTNGFTGSLKATTHDALQSLVGSAGALLALVIWLLAYAPIWIPLALLGRYALKEYRKRETA